MKLLSWNICRGTVDEQHEATQWINRSGQIQDIILGQDPDIFCLQEARRFPNNANSMTEFMIPFDDRYDYILSHSNCTPGAFGLLTAYKRDKFQLIQTVKRWLSTTPTQCSSLDGHFERIVTFCQFENMDNGQKFWVANFHFGLTIEEKEYTVEWLPGIIYNVVKSDHATGVARSARHIILCGDTNFFPDEAEHRFLERLCHHPAMPLYDRSFNMISNNGIQITGTFMGFEHDKFKSSLDQLDKRLDVILSSAGVTVGQVMIPIDLPLPSRDYPSDHFPLVTDFQIPAPEIVCTDISLTSTSTLLCSLGLLGLTIIPVWSLMRK